MKKILIVALMIFTLAFTFACNTPAESTKEESKESETISVEESVVESEDPVIYYIVTFVQDGYESVEIKVESGEGIASDHVPVPKAVVGHDVSWDITDFSNVTSDMTVTAVATPKQYTITYDVVKNGVVIASDTTTVTYGSSYQLEVASLSGFEFKGWTLEGVEFTSGDSYLYDYNITLVAVWEIDVADDSGTTGRY